MLSLPQRLDMKSTDIIQSKINKFPNGYIFTYKDFMSDVDVSFEAIVKYLNRLSSSNAIVKYAKGKYYKPKRTVFGDLKPDLNEVLKDLLVEDGAVIGYFTGISIFSDLGLTTQIGAEIQIGRISPKVAVVRENYRISFIIQKNIITKDNIQYLQLLDALKLIKKIPDTTIVQSCKVIQAKFKKYNNRQLKVLIRLSLKYPANTRALLGCLLEELIDVSVLNKSLNPTTHYEFNGVLDEFPNAKNWNIV